MLHDRNGLLEKLFNRSDLNDEVVQEDREERPSVLRADIAPIARLRQLIVGIDAAGSVRRARDHLLNREAARVAVRIHPRRSVEKPAEYILLQPLLRVRTRDLAELDFLVDAERRQRLA